MKKIIFLLSIAFAFAFIVNVNAQEASTYDVRIGYGESWKSYKPTTVPNATTATDSVWYYTFLVDSKGTLIYDVKLSLDSVSGAVKRASVVLQGKIWESDSYSTIATKAWVLGSDTSITFTNFAANTITATLPNYTTTFPTYSDSTGFTGNFAADSTITLNPNATISYAPSGVTTFTPSATLTLTNSIAPLRYKYFRVLITLANKGFIIKVPECSLAIKEQ